MAIDREMLAQLVAIPSESGQEQEIASYVAERCRAFGRTAVEIGANVAVHIPGDDSSRAFLLNGHIDTVPATEQWQEEPLVMRADPLDENRLVGLGVSDMKAGVATMLEIGKAAKEQRPPCDAWLLFASNEGTDGSGAKDLVGWLAEETRGRYRAIGGLILEPTDAAFFGVGHRGDTLWNINAEGPGGHASKHFDEDPPPVEKISRLIARLPDVRQQWAGDYSDPLLGRPSINPTIINAGKTDNVVPVTAEATLNLRVTPQLAGDLPDIQSALAAVHGVTIEQSWQPQPTRCSPDEQIYKAAQKAVPDAPLRAFPGATDQVAFHEHDMPMLIYGPGDIKAMHQPDEWIHASNIERCRTVVERIMQYF